MHGPLKHTRMQPRSCRGLSSRIAHVLMAVGLLPVIILDPMGPGTIILHDHHEEDLHVHKLARLGDTHDEPGTDNERGHSNVAAGHLGRAGFVLNLPDLPRLCVSAIVPQLKWKSAPPPMVAPTTSSSHLTSLSPATILRHSGGAPLRNYDLLTHLLLSGSSLLL